MPIPASPIRPPGPAPAASCSRTLPGPISSGRSGRRPNHPDRRPPWHDPRMADFEVTRQTTIAASPERLHELIDDFHRWREWSPWEDMDPDLAREYSGAGSGVGARYAWQGNRKAGKGT